MNKHFTRFVLVIMVCSVLVSACSFVDNLASKMGYIPKAQLDDVNARLVGLTQDLEKAQLELDSNNEEYAEIIETNAKLIVLTKELEGVQMDLSRWEDMQCVGPDGNLVEWIDMGHKYALYLPIPQYRADKLMKDFHFKIGATQWKEWVDYPYPYNEMDILLFDQQNPDTLAINISANCIILGPEAR